jgi:excinuclease ABC subunit B
VEQEMLKHARNLEFEEAAKLRDQISQLRKASLGLPTSKVG